MTNIWAAFGRMNQWELSEYTHKNCPEWKHPRGSCLGIDPSDLLVHLGRDRTEAEALSEGITADRHLDRIFARL